MKKLVTILGCFLILISCDSAQRYQRLLTTEPLFIDSINPITTPIKPKYKPCSVHYDVIYKFLDKNNWDKIGKNNSEMAFGLNIDISEVLNHLVWYATIQMEKGGIYSSQIAEEFSSFTFKILTDEYGKIIDFKITSPSMPQNDKIETDQLRKQLVEETKGWEFFGLPRHPVKSGDSFSEIKGTKIKQEIEQEIKKKNKALNSSDRSWIDKLTGEIPDVKAILLGYRTYKGEKVLALSTDYRLTLSHSENKEKYIRKYKSYIFLDPLTYLPVYVRGNLEEVYSDEFKKLVFAMQAR